MTRMMLTGVVAIILVRGFKSYLNILPDSQIISLILQTDFTSSTHKGRIKKTGAARMQQEAKAFGWEANSGRPKGHSVCYFAWQLPAGKCMQPQSSSTPAARSPTTLRNV